MTQVAESLCAIKVKADYPSIFREQEVIDPRTDQGF